MKFTTNNIALFSVFHHDVFYQNENQINTQKLYDLTKKQQNISVEEIAEIIVTNISNAIDCFTDNEISITLTGGMDSRVILACLLKLGIKPNCLTFGSPKSADVIHAKKLADSLGLKFHNAANTYPNKDCYKRWVDKVITMDNGNAHLHRAHRLAAISEHYKLFKPKVLLIGHMGGEGLRGLGYNNYFSSRFFEEVNKKGQNIETSLNSVLQDYFIRQENINFTNLLSDIHSLPYIGKSRSENEFHFLYELIANIHHQQDIRLYKAYIDNVYPVFLQENYLTALFSSKFHFYNTSIGIRRKLNNPKIHSQLIEKIYPQLLNFPLSKGYKPSEYLKGIWYVAPRKIVRKYTSQKKYSSNFSYGKWYFDFVKENSQKISNDIWKHFNKEHYMKALNNSEHQTNEGYWHRFSNPIFFDLRNKLL